MDETTMRPSQERPIHLPSELMSLALDGLLDLAEQQDFDAHLSACEQCTGDWLKWRHISGVLQAEPFVAPSTGFILRVDDAIRRHEKRRERFWGGLLLVGGTLSIWTVLLVGLGLVVAIGTTAYPDAGIGLIEFFGYGGQAVTLIVLNLTTIRDGLLAMLPGPGVTAALAVALAVLSLIWLRLARSTGRRSVESGSQAPTSNTF